MSIDVKLDLVKMTRGHIVSNIPRENTYAKRHLNFNKRLKNKIENWKL